MWKSIIRDLNTRENITEVDLPYTPQNGDKITIGNEVYYVYEKIYVVNRKICFIEVYNKYQLLFDELVDITSKLGDIYGPNMYGH